MIIKKKGDYDSVKQENEQKLERSIEILKELKEARGGGLLDSHRVMGNDPNLVNMFLQQYVNCNKKDISIPKKYRELIVMKPTSPPQFSPWWGCLVSFRGNDPRDLRLCAV